MTQMNNNSGGSRQAGARNRRHSYETESSLTSSRASRKDRQSSGNRLRDTAHSVASGMGDMLSNAATGVIDSVMGTTPSYDYDDNQYYQGPDRGGVRIPTFEEHQLAEQKRQLQFFQEQQRAMEAVVERRQKEDEKKVEEIKEMLKSEIQRFDKLQKQMSENIEKAKKLLLLEQKEVKKGLYHITMAEVLLMALRNAIVDISNSNNWLEALISRKKKRGSLFATRSKQQGTQYSLSQELSLARSTG